MIHRDMKKWVIVVLSGLFFHLTYAQQRYQLDSVVSNWSHYDARMQVTQQQYEADNRVLVYQNEVRGKDSSREEGARFRVKYDERGNEIEYTDSHWNAVKGVWIEREKRKTTYDKEDRMLSYAEYETRREEWFGLSKVTQEYGEGVLTTNGYSGEGKNWMPTYKNVAVFNENEDNVLTMNYQWDSVAGDWDYWMKHENSYRQDTLLQESVSYKWNDGEWINGEKTEYIYPPNSDKVSDRITYLGTTDGWKNRYFVQIEHYVAARREEIFYWSEEEDKWKPESYRETYTDRQGRDTDFVLFIWDEESVEYKRYAQGMTIYDLQDRITLVQEVRYDKGKITEGTQSVYDFDKEGNMYREAHYALVNKDWIEQTTIEFTFNHEIILRDEYDNICVLDQAHIGYEPASSNKYALDSIRSYRHLDGEKVLQEESKYYYSSVPDDSNVDL